VTALPEFAVMAPVAAGVTADPVWMTTFARHVEACGFESIVAVEHTVLMTQYSSVYPYDQSGRVEIPADCPVPDPLDLLAFLAAGTTTLGLATGVLVLPNHHPVVLAKRVATLDALSAGRVRLAVGMGWLREEIEACGARFESRGRRADEQIEVLRLLWEDRPDGADFSGEFFQFAHAACHPTPLRRIPIHVGGHTRAAARRAGRLGDGFQPLGVGGAELAGLVTVMREEADRADRDPDSLELTLGHLVAKVDGERAGRLAVLGADRVVLAMPATSDIDEACDVLSECARRLGLSQHGVQARSDPGRQR
jgi:probable F420-dependent oxidoreductase